ncbi:hypothetical protein ACLQ2P_17385 [Actinomadura citrea]|uniref:hypothetical protein n=1 Tax=Actinomadura citrea TaxID=46158 RepID=UPI003CE47E54
MAGEAGWVEDAGEDPDPCPGSPALMIEEEWAKGMRRSRIDGALGQNPRTALQGNRPTAPPSRKRAWPSSAMRPRTSSGRIRRRPTSRATTLRRARWKDELHDRPTALSTILELIESFVGRAVP